MTLSVADSNPLQAVKGQTQALRTLRAALRTERLASAYLFHGPSGVGKQLCALELATAVIGESQRERIFSGSHPDVRVWGPRPDGKRNIRVEELRENVLPVAQYAPFEAEHAFLIFPEADVSFPAAIPGSANALLKTLEEPRQGVHFILLAERPDRLLPTIRSRAQPVRFSRLSDDIIEDVLRDQGVEDEATRLLAMAVAAGRADRALFLAEEERGAALFDAVVDLDDVARQGSPGDIVEKAEATAKREDRALLLETLQIFYRDIAARGLGVDAARVAFRHRLDILDERAKTRTPGAAAECVRLTLELTENLERNANPQTALDHYLCCLRRAR